MIFLVARLRVSVCRLFPKNLLNLIISGISCTITKNNDMPTRLTSVCIIQTSLKRIILTKKQDIKRAETRSSGHNTYNIKDRIKREVYDGHPNIYHTVITTIIRRVRRAKQTR